MDKNHENSNTLLSGCSNMVKSTVGMVATVFSKIKWKSVSFTIPTVPEPSHRPRLCGYRVYVPGAAKNQSYFDKFVRPKLNGLFIDTPCKIDLNIYCKTPSSFTKAQTVLAEMKIIRPWGNTGDVDNFEKAVYDQMQPNEKRGHVGIMENDSLIIESHTNKYYSITPRYEVTIYYMESIPKKILKILRLDR